MGNRSGRSKKLEDDEESAITLPAPASGEKMGELRPRTPENNASEKKKKKSGPKVPEVEMEMSDDAAKVHLYVRCENLRKSCRCLVAIYTKLDEESEWNEAGHTELSQETRFPNYGFDVTVAFLLYTVQLVRFEAYRVRHESDVGEALKEHQFLGCAEINIMDAVMARAVGDGWYKMPLLNPRPNSPFQGKICIWAEEDASSKSMFHFDLRGEKLRRTDFWKPRTDAFVSIQRGDPVESLDFLEIEGYKGDVEVHQVVRTEVVRRTRKPVFKKIEASVESLCGCKGKQKMIFDVWDWFRIGQPRLIGTGFICYDQIYKNFVDGKPVAVEICRRKEVPDDIPFALTHLEAYDPRKDSSRLIIENVGVVRTYSFLDFMRSGTEIVPIFAIDFTRSTGLRDAGISCGHPLHHLEGEGENVYAEAIQAMAEVLQGFNAKKRFPCYGFGAKVPPTTSVCSHGFAVNGDFFSPEVEGVKNVVDMYLSCLEVARLHGPTYFGPVLELAANWATPYAEVHADKELDMKYFVLVIFTDGGVQDQQLAVNTLVEMTGLPISVVMIEMGDEQDNFLANVTAEVKANQALRDVGERDFITTVRYNETKGNTRAFRHRTLYKLAADVSNYFQAIDVLPRNLDKYEDDAGIPVPRPKVESAPPEEMREEELRKASKASNLGDKTPRSEAGDGDLLDALHAGERELEAAIARLPQFLQDKRVEMLETAVALGYPQVLANRVLKDGLADSSTEILMDNILHSGHGKNPSFKDAIQEVRKRKSRERGSRQTTKDASRVTTKEGLGSRGSNAATDPLEPITDDPEASLPGTVPSTATSKELSRRESLTSKERSTHGSRPSSKLLESRSKQSTKEVNFESSRDVSKEVAGVSGRNVRISKDPPSSAGGRPISPPEARSALRKKGSTKDSNASFRSFRSDGSTDQLRVTLPGAVEYYDSEPAQRATTPMTTKCSICLERKINVEFTPCGHRLACDQCADSVGQLCPLCRTPIRGRKSI